MALGLLITGLVQAAETGTPEIELNQAILRGLGP